MEAMPQEWTEGRLDELSKTVDRGFGQVDQRFDRVEAEIRGVRIEIKDEFKAVRGEINGVRGEINGVREEINGVQRTMVFGFIAMTSAIVTGFAALVSTQV
jgi:archaellum component FlaC